jgi:DNA-binding winged helix-turn-helix (wHTH) protein
LIGIPGVNRSTLLGLLVYNRKIREKHFGSFQEKSHFVLVDFSEIRNRSLADVMKYLFLNLTESLRERGMKEENLAVGDIFREHLKFQDEFLLFQGFKEAVDYLSLEKKISIVFLFSRFEEYVSTVSTDFFANLRALRNRGKYRFSVVFSANRPLEDLLDPATLADYYEFVAERVVAMRLYDKPSGDFLRTHIEKLTHKRISEELVKQIVHLTGGHGMLAKLSFETVIAQDPGEGLEKVLLAQKTIKQSLREIWQSLSPAEQADLLEEKFEDRDVVEYLEHVGLVKDAHIQIPLFSAFIKKEYSEVASTFQKITYDDHTNTIRKGTTVLSDQLTSSEFRLLRYLLQNAERVIERDELISVVWGDNKSIAGITDQAVDQLIFRLRRKIEEDANHPIHLQTVKGRGFTFSS